MQIRRCAICERLVWIKKVNNKIVLMDEFSQHNCRKKRNLQQYFRFPDQKPLNPNRR